MWDSNDTLMALVMLPGIIAVTGGLLLSHRKSVLKMQASHQDPAHLQMLTETARRMEQRIYHLESILDSEAPGWRSRGAQDERLNVAH